MIQQSDPDQTTELRARPSIRTGSGARPVFVDSTGLRRRVARRIAVGVFLTAGAYSLMVLWSLLGGPVAPNSILPFAAPAQASVQTHAPTPATSASTTRAHAAPTASAAATTVRAASAKPAGSASPSSTLQGHRPTSAPGKPTRTATPGHGH